jgi:hypothetical protein
MLPHLVTQYERAVVMLEQIVPRIEDGFHREKEGFYELMEFPRLSRLETSRAIHPIPSIRSPGFPPGDSQHLWEWDV